MTGGSRSPALGGLVWGFTRVLALGLLVPGLSACGGGDGKSLAEKMAADPEAEALAKAGYTPKAKPRPTGLPPPTDAEFKAWDRKDPEGEKHLYKFDKANLGKMLNYWKELDCFREKMKSEGDKVLGGAINRSGVLEIEATTVGEDSSLSKIIALVERAQMGKAPLQQLVDKVSAIFVPVVMAIALFTHLRTVK